MYHTFLRLEKEFVGEDAKTYNSLAPGNTANPTGCNRWMAIELRGCTALETSRTSPSLHRESHRTKNGVDKTCRHQEVEIAFEWES